MHDLNLTLFYHASFDVAASSPSGELLPAVVACVRSWLEARWARGDSRLPADDASWVALLGGGHLVARGGDGAVAVESAFFRAGGAVRQWACRVSETERPRQRAPRTWCTEIGVDLSPDGEGRLSLVSSWGDAPGYLGAVMDPPEPSVPDIVRELAEGARLRCTSSGRPLPLAPVELGAGGFPDFWDFVADEARETPVVFVSPKVQSNGRMRLLVDPSRLARLLGPAAFVFYSTDRAFVDGMRRALGDSDLGCWGGAVRVYAPRPRLSSANDAHRHRYLTEATLAKVGEERLGEVLRRALAQDVSSYEHMTRVETIRERVRRAGIRRRADSIVHAGEREALEWVEELDAAHEAAEREAERLRTEAEELRTEAAGLRAANHALRATVATLRQGAEGANRSGWGAPLGLGRWPLPPTQVARALVASWPERLDLTARGWTSLEGCGKDPEVLWNALADLALIAWGLLSGDGPVDVQRAFNARSTFAYVRGAGGMTRRDARLMQAYRDEYQGRPISCEAHLRRGSDDADPTSIRVYFCYDAPSGRIVVSHCGGHLPTHTGRTLG